MPIKKRKQRGGNSDVSQLLHDLITKKNKIEEKKIKEVLKEVVKKADEKKQDGEGKRKLKGGRIMMTPSVNYPQYGGSFFGDIGDAFSSAGNWVKNAAIDTGNFIKDKKIISNVLGLIPDPRLKAAAAGASMLGLGRKKHRVRRNILKF